MSTVVICLFSIMQIWCDPLFWVAYEFLEAPYSFSLDELNFVQDSKKDYLLPLFSQGSSSVSITSSISSEEDSWDSK